MIPTGAVLRVAFAMARYFSLMRRHGPSPVSSVIVTVDGVIYFGAYYVQNSVVHVQSQFGAKATQVGGARPGGASDDAAFVMHITAAVRLLCFVLSRKRWTFNVHAGSID